MWVLVGLVTLLPGCGKAGGLVRLPVRGTVLLSNGEKLSGSVTFVPTEGRSGPAATTALVEGRYEFDQTNGPTAGRHRVIVKRAISKGPMSGPRDGKTTPAPPGAASRGSPKAEWALYVDVSADTADQCDLNLD